jgi:hypothetical protein
MQETCVATSLTSSFGKDHGKDHEKNELGFVLIHSSSLAFDEESRLVSSAAVFCLTFALKSLLPAAPGVA